MKKIIIQISFFFLILPNSLLFSQDKDFQSWNNLEFTYDIANNLGLSIDNGFRFTENSSVMSKYFFDFSVKRKHNKMFSYSIGYRHLLFRDISPLEIEEKNRVAEVVSQIVSRIAYFPKDRVLRPQVSQMKY